MDWLHAPDYWLARLILQRALGAVYLIAFVVAARQFVPLLGEHGLLPVPRFIAAVPFRSAPSLFHLRYSDQLAQIVAWIGIALAAIAVGGLPETWPLPLTMLLWLTLWALYLSFVNVGQTFYGFGWETLLLEAGFLAIFLGNATTAPPLPLLILFRWLLFRVEFGAGLIKLRGDSCWRDLTCLYYHHETQPMPNPLSWYFHHLPKLLHRGEALGNHVAQLVVPFLLFTPQPLASLAGLVVIVTQSWLMLSGNFSWLNAITIVLAFSAFDGAALGRVLPIAAPPLEAISWYDALVVAVTLVVVALSYWPARNLLSRHQLMNSSFDPLHLVNTYGAFGSVTRERYEVIVEGTDDGAGGPDARWQEYEFIGKPGDPLRRPPQVAPYHLRLDWLMWFLPLGMPSYEWFVPFLVKLLVNDAATLRLLRRNPFADRPPRFVRATLYRYRFSTPRERRETRAWWVRYRVGEYVPPVSLRAEGERLGERLGVVG
ncbi:MAG: lipase maturation factor family protein [Chloroflexi bacterium]|nr:MAG: lipase maturation factor family protein [Chloroflexota bacterium]